MTTNKPEVVGFATHHDEPMLFPSKAEAAAYCELEEEPIVLIRLSDYETLQAECEKLKSELDSHKAARIAYASEFPLDEDGNPDVGSIHQNIRTLKAECENLRKDAERFRWLRDSAILDGGSDYHLPEIHAWEYYSDSRPNVQHNSLDEAIDSVMKEKSQ